MYTVFCPRSFTLVLLIPVDFEKLSTSHKHLQRRVLADEHYRLNAKHMRDCYNNSTRVHTFKRGNIVSLRIPRIDRAATDLHRLPCVVVETLGTKRPLYRLQCQHSVLNVCYPGDELEVHTGPVRITTTATD